jgi:hypothetical protein
MSFRAFSEHLEACEPSEKASLLCRFAMYCGISARGAYPEAGCSSMESTKQLRGYNEVLLIVTSDLDSTITGANPRSSKDFASAVEHWVEVSGIQEGVDHASQMTVRPGTS